VARYLVGIDDTDFGESIGTGALAREAALWLRRTRSARTDGVTRHQLLVHPDIPYTSHNSAACLAVDCDDDVATLGESVAGFVGGLLHEGADPGVCVCAADAALPELVEFGRRAQAQVLRAEDADAVVARTGVFSRAVGGTGLGVIGALAACGLRLGGDDGRFISYPGARELTGTLTAGELVARTGIARVLDQSGRSVEPSALVDTLGWVRPDLLGGEAVLRVESDAATGGYAVVRDKHRDKH